MNKISPLRLLMTLVVTVLILLLLLLGLLLTDTLLNIRQNLQQAPLWLWILLLTAMGLFSLVSGWILMRLLKPRRRNDKSVAQAQVVTESTVTSQLQTAQADGIDVASAEQELTRLRERKQAGTIHIALFGEISSGKSSLVRALLPGSEIEASVLGGTTRNLTEYQWTSPAGDRLVLTDMPGLRESGGALDSVSSEEALRAHLVVYLCEGDLTRDQERDLKSLLALDKPTIIALNKIDRYDSSQLEQIRNRLHHRASNLGAPKVVLMSTGSTEQGIRIEPDGREVRFERETPPRLDELTQAIQEILDNNQEVLDHLRDSAVFTLVKQHLDAALREHRAEQGKKLVQSYTKKAVVGAVAAMTPGTDLLIQGYLATQMIKELCTLHQVAARKIDIELLLQLTQEHVRTHTTLLLAISGNALKAFPGVGTLAGGVLHAVAYGFLFESLGKSINQSLLTRGELHPVQIANQFEDHLGEDATKSAQRIAKLALQALEKES